MNIYEEIDNLIWSSDEPNFNIIKILLTDGCLTINNEKYIYSHQEIDIYGYYIVFQDINNLIDTISFQITKYIINNKRHIVSNYETIYSIYYILQILQKPHLEELIEECLYKMI